MVKHIVLWNFKEELTKEQRKEASLMMKQKLEAVGEAVPGVVSLEVIIGEKDSCTKEIALYSVFESEAALQAYQVHPAHVEAGKYVKSVTYGRECFDYEQ